MNRQEWAKNIRKKLIDIEWTITDLAKATGYSRMWIWQQMTGQKVSKEAVKKISDVLEIEAWNLE